jgi:hypothetical protein
MDEGLDSIKLKIPNFQDKSDPEAYLEWEKKVDWNFDCHNYSKQKNVKLVVIEFTEYALIWWDHIVINRWGNGESDPFRLRGDESLNEETIYAKPLL